MTTPATDKAYGAAIMTTNKWLQFQNRLSDAEKDSTTSTLAETEPATNQLER